MINTCPEVIVSLVRVLCDRWKDKIVIPKPHLDLCSKSILVMDYLDGVRLVDGIKEQYARLAAIQGPDLS